MSIVKIGYSVDTREVKQAKDLLNSLKDTSNIIDNKVVVLKTSVDIRESLSKLQKLNQLPSTNHLVKVSLSGYSSTIQSLSEVKLQALSLSSVRPLLVVTANTTKAKNTIQLLRNIPDIVKNVKISLSGLSSANLSIKQFKQSILSIPNASPFIRVLGINTSLQSLLSVKSQSLSLSTLKPKVIVTANTKQALLSISSLRNIPDIKKIVTISTRNVSSTKRDIRSIIASVASIPPNKTIVIGISGIRSANNRLLVLNSSSKLVRQSLLSIPNVRPSITLSGVRVTLSSIRRIDSSIKQVLSNNRSSNTFNSLISQSLKAKANVDKLQRSLQSIRNVNISVKMINYAETKKNILSLNSAKNSLNRSVVISINTTLAMSKINTLKKNMGTIGSNINLRGLISQIERINNLASKMQLAAQLNKAADAATRLQATLNNINPSRFNTLTSGVNTANNSVQRLDRSLSDIPNRASGFGQVGDHARQASNATGLLTNQVRNFLGVYALVSAAKHYRKLSDEATSTANLLRVVTDSQQEFNDVQARLFVIANNNYASLKATTKQYVAQSGAVKELGFNQEQAYQTIDLFSKALATSGATATEAKAAQLQWSQAIGSGVLRGEEFNSILENGRGVAIALAEGLGVTIGKMREMAGEGELTAEVVLNALLTQSDSINNSFDSMNKTIEQGMQQAHNSLVRLVGNFNDATGASSALAEGFGFAAEAMDSFSEGVESGAWSDVFDYISDGWTDSLSGMQENTDNWLSYWGFAGDDMVHTMNSTNAAMGYDTENFTARTIDLLSNLPAHMDVVGYSLINAWKKTVENLYVSSANGMNRIAQTFNWLKTKWAEVLNWMQSVYNSTMNAMKAGFNSLINSQESGFDRIKGAWKAAGNAYNELTKKQILANNKVAKTTYKNVLANKELGKEIQANTAKHNKYSKSLDDDQAKRKKAIKDRINDHKQEQLQIERKALTQKMLLQKQMEDEKASRTQRSNDAKVRLKEVLAEAKAKAGAAKAKKASDKAAKKRASEAKKAARKAASEAKKAARAKASAAKKAARERKREDDAKQRAADKIIKAYKKEEQSLKYKTILHTQGKDAAYLYKQELKGFTTEQAKQLLQMKKQGDLLDKENKARDKLAKSYKKELKSLSDKNKLLNVSEEARNRLKLALKGYSEEQVNTLELLSKENEAIEYRNKLFEKLDDEYLKVSLTTEAYRQQELASNGLSSATIKTVMSKERLIDTMKKEKKKTEDLQKAVTSITKSAYDSLVEGVLSGTLKAGDIMKKWLKDMAALLIKNALQPIFSPIVNSIGGMFGGGTSGVSGAIGAATGGGGILGSLTSVGGGVASSGGGIGGIFTKAKALATGSQIGNGIASVGKSIGTSIFSNAGSISNAAYGGVGLAAGFLGQKAFGGYGGAGAGIGSTLALAAGLNPLAVIGVGLLGGALGGLFGKKKSPDARGIGLGFSEDGTVQASKWQDWSKKGGWISKTKRGTDWDNELDQSQQDLQKGLQDQFESELENLKQTTEYFGYTTASEAINSFRGGFDRASEDDKEPLKAANEILEVNFDGSDESTNQIRKVLTRNNISTDELDKVQLNENGEDVSEEEATRRIQEWLDNTVSGIYETVIGKDFDKFQAQGEALSSTVKRLYNEISTVKSVTSLLGVSFNKAGLEAADTSTALLKVFDGVDQFVSQSSYFSDNFVSESEKAKLLIESLSGSIAEFNQENKTAINTKEELTAYVKTINVDTEKGRESLKAALDIAPALNQLDDAVVILMNSGKEGAEVLSNFSLSNDEYNASIRTNTKAEIEGTNASILSTESYGLLVEAKTNDTLQNQQLLADSGAKIEINESLLLSSNALITSGNDLSVTMDISTEASNVMSESLSSNTNKAIVDSDNLTLSNNQLSDSKSNTVVVNQVLQESDRLLTVAKVDNSKSEELAYISNTKVKVRTDNIAISSNDDLIKTVANVINVNMLLGQSNRDSTALSLDLDSMEGNSKSVLKNAVESTTNSTKSLSTTTSDYGSVIASTSRVITNSIASIVDAQRELQAENYTAEYIASIEKSIFDESATDQEKRDKVYKENFLNDDQVSTIEAIDAKLEAIRIDNDYKESLSMLADELTRVNSTEEELQVGDYISRGFTEDQISSLIEITDRINDSIKQIELDDITGANVEVLSGIDILIADARRDNDFESVLQELNNTYFSETHTDEQTLTRQYEDQNFTSEQIEALNSISSSISDNAQYKADKALLDAENKKEQIQQENENRAVQDKLERVKEENSVSSAKLIQDKFQAQDKAEQATSNSISNAIESQSLLEKDTSIKKETKDNIIIDSLKAQTEDNNKASSTIVSSINEQTVATKETSKLILESIELGRIAAAKQDKIDAAQAIEDAKPKSTQSYKENYDPAQRPKRPPTPEELAINNANRDRMLAREASISEAGYQRALDNLPNVLINANGATEGLQRNQYFDERITKAQIQDIVDISDLVKKGLLDRENEEIRGKPLTAAEKIEEVYANSVRDKLYLSSLETINDTFLRNIGDDSNYQDYSLLDLSLQQSESIRDIIYSLENERNSGELSDQSEAGKLLLNTIKSTEFDNNASASLQNRVIEALVLEDRGEKLIERYKVARELRASYYNPEEYDKKAKANEIIEAIIKQKELDKVNIEVEQSQQELDNSNKKQEIFDNQIKVLESIRDILKIGNDAIQSLRKVDTSQTLTVNLEKLSTDADYKSRVSENISNYINEIKRTSTTSTEAINRISKLNESLVIPDHILDKNTSDIEDMRADIKDMLILLSESNNKEELKESNAYSNSMMFDLSRMLSIFNKWDYDGMPIERII